MGDNFENYEESPNMNATLDEEKEAESEEEKRLLL